MFKAPSKTSVLKVHDTNNNQPISFAPELIKFVKTGQKYQTYRLADEKYLAFKVGDIISVKEYGGAIIGSAKITGIVRTDFAGPTPNSLRLLRFSGSSDP